jgi:phosphoglycolate phosphatase-like HAD superfamily hydrolase
MPQRGSRKMTLNLSGRVSAFVFDCDGVLLDTVLAKVAAFRDWVPTKHAHLRDEFNRYNLSAFGVSRRSQLRYFYEQLAGMPVTESELDYEVDRFAVLNRQRIFSAPWLPDSREFILQESRRGTSLFVLSGTPQDELRKLLEHHGVASLFRGIIGSPVLKTDALNQIVASLGVRSEKVWFVGDATHDYLSASRAGVSFIYKPSSAEFQVPDANIMTVHSLMEITCE